jgi:serine/threonine protein phosphatase PrpC
MTAEAIDEATRVTLEAWLVTDVGVVRDHNEDSAFMEPSQGFFIVADGMGGHAAGEVASAMAVETVRKTLEDAKPDIEAFKKAPSDAGRRGLVQLLQSAVLQAHQSVYQRGQTETDKQGMGTTLDVVLIAGAEAFVAHVGDSRTYLVRDGRSSQITTDHTVAEVLVIEGKLTIEEAQVSPLRTILVNAIGVSADVGVEMAHVTLKKGDRLLLCSDGLHDYFPIEEEIAQRMSAEKPGEALKEMVDLAKTRGGHDNITGVAVHVIDLVEAAIPEGMRDDSTQPVDVHSPFVDEPTLTAGGPIGAAAAVEAAVNPNARPAQTQPMRALNELTTGPTLPPPVKNKDGKGEAKAETKTEPSADVAADDAQLDKKKKDGAAKPEKNGKDKDAKDKADKDKAGKDSKADKDSKPDKDKASKSDSDDEPSDAVPKENAATADTGRVTAPKKD